MKKFAPFLHAVSFLTILPLPSEYTRQKESSNISESLIWFPLVGGLIGWAAGSMAVLAASHGPDTVAAWVGVAAIFLITGGLHLDGFSDTVDGLAVGGTPQETIQVMRDAHIGAFGVVALVLLLGFQWAFVRALLGEDLPQILAVACCLGRLAMVVLAQLTPYAAGEKGLGEVATGKIGRGVAIFPCLAAMGIAWCGAGIRQGTLSLIVTVVLVMGLRLLFLRRLRGITGDALGFTNEAVQWGVLFILSIR